MPKLSTRSLPVPRPSQLSPPDQLMISGNDDNKISQMLFPRYLDGKNVKFSTVPVALLALEAAHRFRELSN